MENKKNDKNYIIKIRGYMTFLSTIILASLTVSSGLVYIIFQWIKNQTIEDTYFVNMLIGATIILLIALKYLGNFFLINGRDFYQFIISKKDPERTYQKYSQFILNVLNFKRMTFTGIVYGIALGSAPYLLNSWSNQPELQFLLALFMFFINFVTGISLYSLLSFFINAAKTRKLIKIDLWRIENPATVFLLGATRRIAIFASVYISISLSSILFSILPFSGLVIGYSIFSGLIIISSIIIPSFPIMQKIKNIKEKNLSEIDEKLNENFHQTIKNIRTKNSKVYMEHFESLLQLRARINDISVLPFRAKSIMAVASVLVLSALPVGLQLLLENMMK